MATLGPQHTSTRSGLYWPNWPCRPPPPLATWLIWQAASSSLVALPMALPLLAPTWKNCGRLGMASSMEEATTCHFQPASMASQTGSVLGTEMALPLASWHPCCTHLRKAVVWLEARLRKPQLQDMTWQTRRNKMQLQYMYN